MTDDRQTTDHATEKCVAMGGIARIKKHEQWCEQDHNLKNNMTPPCPLRLRFSAVFPLTLCAIQIYLLTYLLEVILKKTTS